MTDRPDLSGLIDAVRLHLESNVLPVVRSEPRLYFQTLVALNLLKIGLREMAQGSEMLRLDWLGLNQLTGDDLSVPNRPDALRTALKSRHRKLCEAIRRGEYDGPVVNEQLTAYLEPIVTGQLILNNPNLAQRISAEIASGQFAE